jgi:hypothetical protein
MRKTRRGPAAPRPELVYHPRRSVPAAIVPVLVAVAVLGYVAGHSGGKSEPSDHRARTAKSANVLVEYPLGWAPAVRGASSARGAPIPGLTLAHARLLGPHGDATAAGLYVGSLAPSESGPLPASFLERVRRQPRTTIVELVELQAYRYTELSVRGFSRVLSVFMVPDPGAQSTVLACYAPSAQSRYMRECEQTVASVAIVGQPQTYALTPEAGYAQAISTAIAKLDKLRVALTRELQPQTSATDAERLARRLAAGYAAAGAALGKLEPGFATQRAQATLTSAIDEARLGYKSLASAAAQRSASAYATAQTRIAAGETDVDRALEDFVLLGYNPALSAAAD